MSLKYNLDGVKLEHNDDPQVQGLTNNFESIFQIKAVFI